MKTSKSSADVGADRIRHFLFLKGRWRWRPTKAMRDKGFRLVSMSKGYTVEGVPTAAIEDQQRALELNEDWDRVRTGRAAEPRPQYPPGSVGEAWLRVMKIRKADREAAGVIWTKEQEKRDDWPRAWKWIGPVFGRSFPKNIEPEHLIGDTDKDLEGLYQKVLRKVSRGEAHRVIKVWRAFWKRMGLLKYCDADRDPSLMFRNKAPDPRTMIVDEGFVVRIIKRAWREGEFGLAAICSMAWDTQLSPIDVRNMRAGKRGADAKGTYYGVDRAKTGRPAIGTLSKRAVRMIDACLEKMFKGSRLHPNAKIFRTPGGRPFTKDTLGRAFRKVRDLEFGPDDKRWLSDFRRTGTVEAVVGGARPNAIGAKMANTFGESNQLQKTYSPGQIATVREVDDHRLIGRKILREQKTDESVTAPVQEVSPRKVDSA